MTGTVTPGSVGSSKLAPMDRERRIHRLRQTMREVEVEAAVITKAANIRWLTGFTGSNGTVVVTETDLSVITDGRYRTQLGQQLEAAAVDGHQIIERQIEEPLRRAVGTARRVGLEADHVTWAQQRSFAQWLEPTAVVATTSLVEELRRVKDQGEIDRLARAAAVADDALVHIADRYGFDDPTRFAPGAEGPTEREVARQLETAMLDLGADDRSFATIVASGPNSALPHARPSDRRLTAGDLLIIDFGASVDGYGSDMTRTFRLGAVPARADEMYHAVAEAQQAGLDAVAAGAAEVDVDAACRRKLEARGLDEAFIHGTGHGIGLEIHEEPFMSTRSTGILRSSQVITVEPGVYLAGFGGVRIEDSVVVTDTGCQPITRYPKPPVG